MMVWQVDDQWKTIRLSTIMLELDELYSTAEKLPALPDLPHCVSNRGH